MISWRPTLDREEEVAVEAMVQNKPMMSLHNTKTTTTNKKREGRGEDFNAVFQSLSASDLY